MAWCLLGTKPLPEPMLTYCQVDPQKHISVKSYLKFKHILETAFENIVCKHFGHLVFASFVLRGSPVAHLVRVRPQACRNLGKIWVLPWLWSSFSPFCLRDSLVKIDCYNGTCFSQVEVTYLDYGDNDTLALCDVRLLGPDENKLPYQVSVQNPAHYMIQCWIIIIINRIVGQ